MERRSVAALVALTVMVSSCGGGEEIGATTVGVSGSTTVPGATTTLSAATTPSTSDVTTSLPPTTVAVLRPVTSADPLVVWAIGDSFLEIFGPALVNRCSDTGLMAAEVDFRYVSGLSRPDYFDWPAYIASELPEVSPDVAVVMFGGNDAQDVEVGGERFDVGTQGWVDLYATRVAEAMDVLVAGVERVYWIGLPIMKSDRFTANAQTMNGVYQAEAALRPSVTYFSSFELFQDVDGEYNAYLDGKLMRFTDGAHFVWNGAYRLADAVLPVIAADWDIELTS